MTISLRLAFFREYKNWSQEDVARELNLSTESYEAIEKGRVKINGIFAQKLSDLYQVPIEFFLIDDTPHYMQAEVIYTNCTMQCGQGGSNGYINHQNNDRGIDEILFSKKEEIKTLKEQLAELHKQNARLIELLGSRVKEGRFAGNQ